MKDLLQLINTISLFRLHSASGFQIFGLRFPDFRSFYRRRLIDIPLMMTSQIQLMTS